MVVHNPPVRTRDSWSFLHGIVLLAALTGCDSDPHPELVPVTGTVYVDGVPATKGTVSFLPADPMGNSASANIDESGHYEASTYEPGDGIKPGDYRIGVNINKKESTGNSQTGQIFPAVPLLSEKYMDPTQSGIKTTITDGEAQVVDIEVSAKK